MLKRTISGAVYIAIIVGFFFMRNLIDYRLFDILICAFSLICAFEMATATSKLVIEGVPTLTLIIGGLFVPVYFLAEMFLTKYRFYIAFEFVMIPAIVVALICLFKNKTKEQLLFSIISIIYPTVLLLPILMTNSFGGDKGFIGLLLIFTISPVADVLAYLVGMTYNKIRKGNAKRLCPNVSPNKTFAGAIGGLIGGIIVGLALYFILVATIGANKIGAIGFKLPLLAFILLGLFGAVLTEVGDLFESFIKRKIGVKDMGDIMPGHGGITDRIDGMTFCSILVYIVFVCV